MAFDAHAAECAECGSDALGAREMFSAIAAARDDESWRPALDNLIAGRIRDSRARRSTFTVRALGWAVAASIVINVAFASGFTAHLATAFRETGEARSSVVATRLEIGTVRPLVVSFEPRRAYPHLHLHLNPNPKPNQHPRAARAPEIPDVLAGLDVERDGRTRVVALEWPGCDAVAGEVVAHPCPAAAFEARR